MTTLREAAQRLANEAHFRDCGTPACGHPDCEMLRALSLPDPGGWEEGARAEREATIRWLTNFADGRGMVRSRNALAADLATRALPVPPATTAPRIAWQCSGCHWGFAGPWQKTCPACGREDYWCGSVAPTAKLWRPQCACGTPSPALHDVACPCYVPEPAPAPEAKPAESEAPKCAACGHAEDRHSSAIANGCCEGEWERCGCFRFRAPVEPEETR